MPYVLVSNGVVTEKTFTEPNIIFNESYADQFFYTDAEVEIGWLYDGEVFTAPPSDELDPLEQALTQFRADRTARLSTTDWWAIRASEPGGVPMTEEQLAYRQALRVMDDAEDFDPLNPQWPAEPGA